MYGRRNGHGHFLGEQYGKPVDFGLPADQVPDENGGRENEDENWWWFSGVDLSTQLYVLIFEGLAPH